MGREVLDGGLIQFAPQVTNRAGEVLLIFDGCTGARRQEAHAGFWGVLACVSFWGVLAWACTCGDACTAIRMRIHMRIHMWVCMRCMCAYVHAHKR